MNASTGLIHAFLLDGNGGGRFLNQKEVKSWKPDQGRLWLHFDYTNESAQAWLHNESGLDDLITEALLTEDTRPRAVRIENGLLMALRDVNQNPGADPEDMVSIRLWVDSDRIISTRKRNLLSTQDLLSQLEQNQGPRNGSEFIVQLAEELVRHMGDTVDQLEDQVADLENTSLSSSTESLRHELANLRRQIITLRRYFAPEKEAFSSLLREYQNWFHEEFHSQIREANDRLIRHIEDIDAVRERAAITHEELNSRVSEQLNERMYVLAIVAAIFLPLGFLTGLLGINVGGIPGAGNAHAFWLFALLLAAVALGLLLLLRLKRWV